tara:strand:+ start:2007 stop:2321 length:315 start_codon:yes stop_codon:yes gene_type:complete
MHMYHKSRYRARKKYYEKEENKEKKRIYMREYYQKNKEKRRNYIKNYHQKIKDVEFEEIFGQEEKEELNASYKQSLANKKEREEKANEELNIINSERFIDGAQK